MHWFIEKNLFQVTGGNKGIGFAIVRGLCKQIKKDVDIDVYLTGKTSSSLVKKL